GSFARQMQIHLRSFIRPARTTLLRAEIGGGASLSGPYGAGRFTEMPGQVVPPTGFESAATNGQHMAGKFELCKEKSGKFRFRVKARKGEIIATGEAYESKAGAEKGIGSVKKNAADAKVIDLTR